MAETEQFDRDFWEKRWEQAVRELWSLLDRSGTQSLGSVPGADYQPHVSFAVFNDGEVDAIASAVRAPAESLVGLPISLTAIGFFMTEEAPAFLAVIPSLRLVSAHRELVDAVRPVVRGFWPYYDVDALFPHCTLAMGVASRERTMDVLSGISLPIVTAVKAVHLVDVLTGRSVARLAGT